MDFRPRIKMLCAERNTSMTEIAKKMGISKVSLSKSLGSNYPSLRTLEKIATILAVPVGDLFPPNQKLKCPRCGEELDISIN